MDDLKNDLERLAELVDERDVNFERLERARDRRNRTRRITAGVLAITVALAGTLTAVAAFRDQPGTTAVDSGQTWQPPDTLTVWPESPVTGPSPADVQAAVDAGDSDVQWRLDPVTVGQRFARGILGWVDVDTIHDVTQNESPKMVTLVPCPHAATCRPIGTLDLTLVQPATQGADGIWSVNAVTSRDLGIDVGVMDPAAGLAGGSDLGFDITVPAAVSAHIGMVAENGCRTATAFDDALSNGAHKLTLPKAKDADPSCGRIGAGYLFAYATDDTTIPSPDPLTEPTAIEFPWITIVPIYLEMETGPSATATESAAVSDADTP